MHILKSGGYEDADGAGLEHAICFKISFYTTNLIPKFCIVT